MPRRRTLRRNFQFVLYILYILSTLYPPPVNRSRHGILRWILPVLLLLVSLVNPPHGDQLLPIMQRLDPTFFGSDFRGRNVFGDIENQRFLFWLNTGELPETLVSITTRVSVQLSRLTRRGGVRQRSRMSKLSNINKVLLTLMWLRKYPCIDTLALFFDVSPATISSIIHGVVPVLWRYFSNQVTWPPNAEWNNMRGNWRSFPDAVGCIDGTPHEIFRPQSEPQAEFFSGHRHYHLMNTQLIIDNCGNIAFLQAGFLGAMNDSGNYLLMERIGPRTNYDLPVGVSLLADKGYADVAPLLTPFRAIQIRRMPRDEQRLARKFNRKHSKCRILIEHTIKHVKTYQAVGSLWRHPRWFQPIVVELCTFLAQRHIVLFENI